MPARTATNRLILLAALVLLTPGCENITPTPPENQDVAPPANEESKPDSAAFLVASLTLAGDTIQSGDALAFRVTLTNNSPRDIVLAVDCAEPEVRAYHLSAVGAEAVKLYFPYGCDADTGELVIPANDSVVYDWGIHARGEGGLAPLGDYALRLEFLPDIADTEAYFTVVAREDITPTVILPYSTVAPGDSFEVHVAIENNTARDTTVVFGCSGGYFLDAYIITAEDAAPVELNGTAYGCLTVMTEEIIPAHGALVYETTVEAQVDGAPVITGEYLLRLDFHTSVLPDMETEFVVE